MSASKRLIERRRAARYTLTFPENLPVAQARPAILKALQAHRVIVVCGDTGSGKTTQLPKLCLEAGRGVLGMIGHTQPRRIAEKRLEEQWRHATADPSAARHSGASSAAG